MSTEDLLGRSLKLLQGAIRASDYTQTDIDERIGRRRGYLSHVFQRRVDLKLVDLLRALEVLGIDARRFFVAVVEGRTGGGSGVLTIIAGKPPDLPAAPPTPAAAPQPVDPALEERVRSVVRRLLPQLETPGKKFGT